MKDIFNLEQDIMQCWNVVDDLKTITEYFVESPQWQDMDPKLCDALMNKYLGLKEVYDVRFEKLWKTFEDVAKEHHRRGRLEQVKDSAGMRR